MTDSKPPSISDTRGATSSRRNVLSMLLGACSMPVVLAAADSGPAVRFAISESLAGDVNLNDARVAMQVWIVRMSRDLNLAIDAKLFPTTPEIVARMRAGQLDAVALNILEYRQLADWLDSSQLVTAASAAGLEQYMILARQSSGIRLFADLKGRRISILKAPRMCVAPAWLATKRGFDTMCELNPQVARGLKIIASSPPMVVSFYAFRRNYRSVYRERLIQAISGLHTSAAGRQLAMLFQFPELTVLD
ncbi:MAG: hypothetical protein NTY38_20120, partial [Acidobacteria bacterium]|nr:hypothetical protein [Acidobacteriota bacterium]